MAIPESQLKTWAKRHQTQKAVNTHIVIRDVIRNFDYSRNYDFDDYLQGSYSNYTNIWADTDVDIVIQLNSVFRRDTSNLTLEQQELYRRYYSAATYGLDEFKEEVINALNKKFGYERILIGNKSIKVLADNYENMYDADVVICQQYRLYVPSRRKNTTKDELTGLYYYEGIWFKTSYGEEIINYPKLHYKNGVDKHQSTGQKFKPVVRIFKNMRNTAMDRNYLYSKNVAPSYFIQCLLYNVPDDIFVNSDSYQKLTVNILAYLSKALLDEKSYKSFISQNEIVPLFGEGSDKWNISDARKFIKAIIKMWKDWK
jgi:hypothetical protein